LNCRRVLALIATAALALPLGGAITQPVRTTGGLVSGVPVRTRPSRRSGNPLRGTPGRSAMAGAAAAGRLAGSAQSKRFSASCIQNIVKERKPGTYEFMAHNQISEDCLYLNVWTPAKSARRETVGVLLDAWRWLRRGFGRRSGL